MTLVGFLSRFAFVWASLGVSETNIQTYVKLDTDAPTCGFVNDDVYILKHMNT